MNKFFQFVFFACMVAALPAGGGKEKETAVPIMQVTGRVRLVGTGVFPELVISGTEKEWYVDREEQSKLMDLQHRTVTVEGHENVLELKFAGGQSAGERRTLKNIRIIAVE